MPGGMLSAVMEGSPRQSCCHHVDRGGDDGAAEDVVVDGRCSRRACRWPSPRGQYHHNRGRRPSHGRSGSIRTGAEERRAHRREEWNAKGGVLGKRIEILWGDDQHDPKQAVSVANKFVNEGVVGVIGHFNSSCSIPASTIYHDGKIVQLTPASTNPDFTERGLWNVFRVCGRDDQQGSVAATFIAKKLKKSRVAVLHDKTTYGQGLANETLKALEKAKVKPVYYGGITQGEKDYRPVLTAMKGKDPEVLFYGGIYPEAILLTKQMRELGMKSIFVSGDGVWTKEY